jgi:hypothetical protein
MESGKVKTGFTELDSSFLTTTNDLELLRHVLADDNLRSQLRRFDPFYCYCIPNGTHWSMLIYCDAKQVLNTDGLKTVYEITRKFYERLSTLSVW